MNTVIRANRIHNHRPLSHIVIESKKAEESSVYLKYMRINDGTFKKRNRNSKDVQRDLLIQTAKFNLVSNSLSDSEYLEEVSKAVHDFSNHQL